jgi:hypothetical protein
MGIKRYFAKLDNTITNAYMENLKTRGTASNMGASDILEVFSIYGQANTSSAEKSRALIKFNATASTNSIKYDRDNSRLPASGSVNFYLRLFNAPHGQTLPKSYTMDVSAVSGGWEEGTGLDMEAYKDKDESNWTNAVSTNTSATATVTIANDGWVEAGATVTLVATDGTSVVATAHATTTTSTAQTTAVQFARNGGSNAHVATELATAINYSSYFSATPDGAVVTITQAATGRNGNTTVTIAEGGATGFSKTDFTGGDGAWVTAGGDYYSDTPSSFSASFDNGTENLEVNITTLVEQWLNSAGNILGSKEDEGVGVFISNTYASEARSYYTKKFFARGTEFFFKQPCIEARWDSSAQDDRGNFYYSSSLATAAENLNTIYLYNYFRGRLRNIPAVGTSNIYVSFFSGSSDDTAPAGSVIQLVADGTHVLAATPTVVTGGHVSTGIYTASVALTAAATPISTLYDVWFSGVNQTPPGSPQYYTGSISPKIVKTSITAPNDEHVLSITNLKNIYRNNENARLRVYSRPKNWNPTIYSKATATAEIQIAESGSYEIYRVVDDFKVIPYGTGSDKHTVMSYDASGSYFDLDMKMLESGYMYGVNFSFYNEDLDSWVEQPDTFKFKVQSRQN